MSETSQAGPGTGPENQPPRRTVSRLVGLGISATTAVVVLAAGSVLWPSSPRTPQNVPSEPAAAVPPTGVPAPAASQDAFPSETSATEPLDALPSAPAHGMIADALPSAPPPAVSAAHKMVTSTTAPVDALSSTPSPAAGAPAHPTEPPAAAHAAASPAAQSAASSGTRPVAPSGSTDTLPSPAGAPPTDASPTQDASPAEFFRAATGRRAFRPTPGSESKPKAQDAPADASATEAVDGNKKASDRASAKKHPKEPKEPKEKDGASKTSANSNASAPAAEKSRSESRIAAKPANTPMAPTDGTAPPLSASEAAKAASADCQLSDKDMAREAWRRNWPTICPLAGGEKAFIVIPIKGSIAGEIHELRHHPGREARVVLPLETESQLTLKQYKLNRFGFKELKINSMDDGRTRLRVRLQPETGDPIFEVKEGYAKITVATHGGGT